MNSDTIKHNGNIRHVEESRHAPNVSVEVADVEDGVKDRVEYVGGFSRDTSINLSPIMKEVKGRSPLGSSVDGDERSLLLVKKQVSFGRTP